MDALSQFQADLWAEDCNIAMNHLEINLLIPCSIPDVPEKSQIINTFDAENDFHEVGLPKYGRSPKLIEGTVGQTVILSCIVHNLGSKRVSDEMDGPRKHDELI